MPRWIQWMTLSYLLYSLAASASPPPDAPAEGSAGIPSLVRLLQSAKIVSEPAFERVLEAHRLGKDHRAPPTLRALLTGREIVRMNAFEGYQNHQETHMWTWASSEVGFVGESKEVEAYVTGVLTQAGFELLREDARPGRWYRNEETDFIEEVMFEGPEDWVGGTRVASSVGLTWWVRSKTTAPVPTLRAVQATLPVLVDTDVDARLYSELATTPVTRLSLGGTWTERYSLSATFRPDASSSAEALHTRLHTLLEGIGFRLDSQQPRNRYKRYIHDARRSYVQLYAPDEHDRVALHYQPRS